MSQILISQTDSQGYSAQDFLSLSMANFIKAQMSSGKIKVPSGRTEIYMVAIIDKVPTPDGQLKLAYKITQTEDISLASYEDVITHQKVYYKLTSEMRYKLNSNSTWTITPYNLELVEGRLFSDDDVNLTFNFIPFIELGYGFRDMGIHRFIRPKLYFRPINKYITVPKEYDAVLTMSMTGIYREATIINVHILGEEGGSVSTDINRITMTDTPYVQDPHSIFSTDQVPRFIPESEIYEHVKGVALQLVRHHYNIDDSVSDAFILKHYQVTEHEVYKFEHEVANVADDFWRALEK